MVSPLEGDYTDLGALYIQIGRYKEAEDNLFEAIKRSAHNTQAHVELGNLYLARESVKDAILEFRQAVSIDPSNEEASRALSIALMQKGDFSAAEKILQDAIRAYSGPDRWQLHLTLAQLLTEVGNKTSDLKAYEAGLDQINKAIKLNPLHPQPYFYGGIVRTKLGLYDASIRNFQTCLEKDKDNYLAERYIGLLRSQLREEHRRSQGSVIAGWLIAGFATVQLVALWYFYLTTSKVTEQTLTVIAPTLLVMIVLGLLVPRLIKFKIPGFEAELKQPLEAVASGPKGEVGFGALTVSTNPGPR